MGQTGLERVRTSRTGLEWVPLDADGLKRVGSVPSFWEGVAEEAPEAEAEPPARSRCLMRFSRRSYSSRSAHISRRRWSFSRRNFFMSVWPRSTWFRRRQQQQHQQQQQQQRQHQPFEIPNQNHAALERQRRARCVSFVTWASFFNLNLDYFCETSFDISIERQFLF